MNASECVARGCALQCAILSPTFKVREFQVNFPPAVLLSSLKCLLQSFIIKGIMDFSSCFVIFWVYVNLP